MHTACIRWTIVVAAALSLVRATVPAPSAAQRGGAYDDEIQKGETSLRRAEFQQALDSFKHALAANATAEALFGIARAYEGLDSHKLAVEYCGQALSKANGDVRLEAEIRNLRGTSLMALAQRPDDPRLKEAEAD